MSEIASMVRLYAANAVEKSLMMQDMAFRSSLGTSWFEMPDPKRVILRMTRPDRKALLNAHKTREGYAVPYEWHKHLNRYGLVDARRPFLSAFGLKVRAHLQGSARQ